MRRRFRRDARAWRSAEPALLQFARRALVEPDVAAVCADAAALALRLLDVDLISVWELQPDGVTLACRACAGPWPGPQPPTMHLDETPLAAHAIVTLQTVTAGRLTGEPRFPPPVRLLGLGVRGGVLVPMAGRNGAVGVICAYKLAPGSIAAPQVDILEALAELLGAVVCRRRDEHELRAAEERYRTLVEQAPVCIQGIDRAARVDAVNEAGLRMMGLEREAALGRSYLDLVAPADRPRVAMLLSQALEGRPSEFDFDSADGRRSFSSSFIPLPGPAGEVSRLIGVTQDVTARRRAEAQLREAQKMEALGRMAGGVAHDFNNLVTAISGYAQLAQRELPEGADRAARDIGAIVEAAGLAGTLTRRLLDFSRRQAVEKSRLDAAALVSSLEELLRRLVGERVRLVLEADVGDCWVDADAAGLEQMVLNLAVNARDAMPGGGDLTIRCAPVRGRALVRLTVADTGTGMDAATRARVFEPFFTTKPPGVGTGLGLATVYAAVEAVGGAISVDSEPGRGTTFTIDLRRAASAHVSAPADAPSGADITLV